MRAVPVTPRQVMFTVCGQCPSLHAEGLNEDYEFCIIEYLHLHSPLFSYEVTIPKIFSY